MTVGSAVAADSTNGTLKPTAFTGTGGASASIGRIAYESGQVKIKVTPVTALASQVVEVIELDGTGSLSLSVSAATVDAANNTLSWAVVVAAVAQRGQADGALPQRALRPRQLQHLCRAPLRPRQCRQPLRLLPRRLHQRPLPRLPQRQRRRRRPPALPPRRAMRASRLPGATHRTPASPATSTSCGGRALAGGAWKAISDSSASTTSHTVTGLTNGTEYRFHVRAVSAGGTGTAAPNGRALVRFGHAAGACAGRAQRPHRDGGQRQRDARLEQPIGLQHHALRVPDALDGRRLGSVDGHTGQRARPPRPTRSRGCPAARSTGSTCAP